MLTAAIAKNESALIYQKLKKKVLSVAVISVWMKSVFIYRLSFLMWSIPFCIKLHF